MAVTPTKRWAESHGFKPARDNDYEFRLSTPSGAADLFIFSSGHIRFKAFVLHGKRTQSVVELEGPTVERIGACCEAIGFVLPMTP